MGEQLPFTAMTLPNFLVIGAAKSGTSALHQYLLQHPAIFLHPTWKEARFFAYDGHPPTYRGPGDLKSNRRALSSLDAYAAYFRDVKNETAVGEVSPVYLFHERAPACIQRYVPDVKLIAVLRHPVDRGYSHFLHLVRDHREPLRDFAQALAEEDARVEANWEWSWFYRRVGRYADQLERYFARFDRRQIQIHLYDDFEADPVRVCQSIFRFLGVDDGFVPDSSKRYNESTFSTNPARTRRLLAFAHAVVPVKRVLPTQWWRRGSMIWRRAYASDHFKPTLDPDLRRQLTASCQDEIHRLETLIERDLSHWLA